MWKLNKELHRRFAGLKVSEGLNSVETLLKIVLKHLNFLVSEGLNSVETTLHPYIREKYSKFQKDLIVWKLSISSLS